MVDSFDTPDWDEQDMEICRKSDEMVESGEMTYRHIR